MKRFEDYRKKTEVAKKQLDMISIGESSLNVGVQKKASAVKPPVVVQRPAPMRVTRNSVAVANMKESKTMIPIGKLLPNRSGHVTPKAVVKRTSRAATEGKEKDGKNGKG